MAVQNMQHTSLTSFFLLISFICFAQAKPEKSYATKPTEFGKTASYIKAPPVRTEDMCSTLKELCRDAGRNFDSTCDRSSYKEAAAGEDGFFESKLKVTGAKSTRMYGSADLHCIVSFGEYRTEEEAKRRQEELIKKLGACFAGSAELLNVLTYRNEKSDQHCLVIRIGGESSK